jgi:hypothetical protein
MIWGGFKGINGLHVMNQTGFLLEDSGKLLGLIDAIFWP